jgi:peptide/nickel transport system ATP-binding protein
VSVPSAEPMPPLSATDAGSAPRRGEEQPLVEVHDLRVTYSLRGSFLDRLRGREAGSVKTTLGRALLGLVEPASGSIRFDGREITGLGDAAMRPLRRRMQIVFQDPHASLNPAMTIGASVGDPLRFHGAAPTREQRERRVAGALERVGLAPASQFAGKMPGDLSGGQKQRAVLARAIILGPDLLIADEPVSMLDMSVRAKILELMMTLKDEFDLTYVYITHDLATAKFFCDRIAIMYLGRIVELGPAERIYADPKHPYTRSLLRAIPEPDPSRSVPRDIPRGEIPDAVAPPLGCRFHPRCPQAFEVCGWESRDLGALLEQHWTGLSEDEYERERARIGEVEAVGRDPLQARLPAGRGHPPTTPLEVLEAIRSERPDDPFWRGVAEVGEDDRGARVRFHPGIDPRDVDVDGTRVQCHLHDPEALAEAERLRS